MWSSIKFSWGWTQGRVWGYSKDASRSLQFPCFSDMGGRCIMRHSSCPAGRTEKFSRFGYFLGPTDRRPSFRVRIPFHYIDRRISAFLTLKLWHIEKRLWTGFRMLFTWIHVILNLEHRFKNLYARVKSSSLENGSEVTSNWSKKYCIHH